MRVKPRFQEKVEFPTSRLSTKRDACVRRGSLARNGVDTEGQIASEAIERRHVTSRRSSSRFDAVRALISGVSPSFGYPFGIAPIMRESAERAEVTSTTADKTTFVSRSGIYERAASLRRSGSPIG